MVRDYSTLNLKSYITKHREYSYGGKFVIYKIIPGTESKCVVGFCFIHFDRFAIVTLVAAIPRSVQVSDGLSSETGND